MAFKYKRPSEEELEKRASSRGGDFESFVKDEYRTYTPKKQNGIRILPRDEREEGAQSYSDEIYVHYGIGPNRASVLCPARMASMPCPICEERARAEKREDTEAVKELRSTRRYIAWVLDKKADGEVTPLLWAMPQTVESAIAKVSKDPQTGSRFYIDDPYEGYDVYFDVDGEGMQKKYIGFQIARRPTSVDTKILDFLSENLLQNVLVFRNYEEIKLLFEGAPPPPAEHVREPELQRAPAAVEQAPDKDKPEPTPAEPEPKPTPSPSPAPAREPAPAGAAATGSNRAADLRARFAARKDAA